MNLRKEYILVYKDGSFTNEELSCFDKKKKTIAIYRGRHYVVKKRDNGNKEIIVRAKEKKPIPYKTKRKKPMVDNPFICDVYLDYIRSLPCLVCRTKPVDPHHLIARKWRESDRNDFSAVPLCRYHHTLIEEFGIREFNSKFSLDIWQEAFFLATKWLLRRK